MPRNVGSLQSERVPANLVDRLLEGSSRTDEMSAAAKRAAAAEIGARIVRLGGLQGALLAESIARRDDSDADEMLAPKDVARRLGVTTIWVYKNWKTRLPFGVKVSHKAVRFSARKVEHWLAVRRETP